MNMPISADLNTSVQAILAQAGLHTQSSSPSATRLIEQFGREAVAAAGNNEFIKALGKELIEYINSSSDPQAIKDKWIQKVGEWIESNLSPVDPACAAAVAASGYGQFQQNLAVQMVEGAASRATGVEATGAGQSTAADADADFARANGEAGSGGGTEGAGGGGASAEEAAMRATAGLGDDEDNKKSKAGGKGGGNIMMRIARELGRIQDKFLQLAMKSLDQMKAGAESAGPSSGGGSGDNNAFMTAQSEFQAYMQLFNMTNQAASTGLKTLGEAGATMARKQ